MSRSTSKRVIVVGGGFAGLSVAARLAQEGIAVTLLEAATLGMEASLRNQGWLHSGAWFARGQTDLARMCFESLRRTIDYCPTCIEPNHEGMFFVTSLAETNPQDWTQAWKLAEIPFEEIHRDRLLRQFPSLDPARVQQVFLLPDRSFRPEVLLWQLAEDARQIGVEIREHVPVAGLLYNERRVRGVVTGKGEEISARGVIFATGAWDWRAELATLPKTEQQSMHEHVALKTHLIAVSPEISTWPLCAIDQQGFNHLPHEATSVFGTSRWQVVRQAGDVSTVEKELAEMWRLMTLFFPDLNRDECADVKEWAGTTLQLMHPHQIEPGKAPLPTVIDHRDVPPSLENLWSVSPGRATLWSHLAEETCRRVTTALRLGNE